MKQPTDFLRLLEDLARFKHRDKSTNFFEYYLKNYIFRIPKLFIYGKWDFVLRPFALFEKNRLEKFYKSCGNAEIVSGPYGHLIPQEGTTVNPWNVIADTKITEKIIRFIDKNS
jgi:Serine hydrolase (FSH1)